MDSRIALSQRVDDRRRSILRPLSRFCVLTHARVQLQLTPLCVPFVARVCVFALLCCVLTSPLRVLRCLHLQSSGDLKDLGERVSRWLLTLLQDTNGLLVQSTPSPQQQQQQQQQQQGAAGQRDQLVKMTSQTTTPTRRDATRRDAIQCWRGCWRGSLCQREAGRAYSAAPSFVARQPGFNLLTPRSVLLLLPRCPSRLPDVSIRPLPHTTADPMRQEQH